MCCSAGQKRQPSPLHSGSDSADSSPFQRLEALARESSLTSSTFGMPSFLPPVRIICCSHQHTAFPLSPTGTQICEVLLHGKPTLCAMPVYHLQF